jgi:hypothetical protein
LDTSEEETFISVTGYCKLYSTADCIIDIEDCMGELKPMALKGCWKKLCPEADNDLLDSSTSRMK